MFIIHLEFVTNTWKIILNYWFFDYWFIMVWEFGYKPYKLIIVWENVYFSF